VPHILAEYGAQPEWSPRQATIWETMHQRMLRLRILPRGLRGEIIPAFRLLIENPTNLGQAICQAPRDQAP